MEKCEFAKSKSIVKAAVGFVTSDKYIAKVGDWVYCPSKLKKPFLDTGDNKYSGFCEMRNKCFEQGGIPQRHRIVAIDDETVTTNLMKFKVWQFEMYAVKANAKRHGSTEIANGKFVRRGDKVWLWRNTQFYTTLVCKTVVECSQVELKCAYEGNAYSRRENRMCCYATKKEALQAQPCSLEHPFKRVGVLIGKSA